MSKKKIIPTGKAGIPRNKPPNLIGNTQKERFIETAKALESDESGKSFEKAMKKLGIYSMKESGMNIHKAIDLAITEDRQVTYETEETNEEIRNQIKIAGGSKGCALMKQTRESNEVTVYPPSQCTVLHYPDRIQILPTILCE